MMPNLPDLSYYSTTAQKKQLLFFINSGYKAVKESADPASHRIRGKDQDYLPTNRSHGVGTEESVFLT